MQKSSSNNVILKDPIVEVQLEKRELAIQLPSEWDDLSTSYFQRKKFLTHTEKYNPCNQIYYLLYEGQYLIACAVVYSLDIDFFSFKGIKSPVKMRVVGLPVSVASPGIFGSKAGVRNLLELIQKEERGFLLALNLESDFQPATGIKMRMMPTIEFANKYSNFQEYLLSLRAPYRRRYNQLFPKSEGLIKVKSGCDQFTNAHYKLYQDIIDHTKTKLEILSTVFFKNLPEEFTLTSFYTDDFLVSWYITCDDGNSLVFFFGGHSFRLNDQYKLYFNNLFSILNEFIETGYDRCDFGQTAETPKLKLGGLIVEKSMVLYHENKAVRWLTGRTSSLLGYSKRFQEFRVFK